MIDEIENIRYIDDKKKIIRVYFKDNYVSDFKML